MDAIVLVGGFGTRLLPLTEARPKPFIPLVNVPFVERTVRQLAEIGVKHVILSLHYNAEQFIDHFSRLALNIKVSFSLEETPLGTGGAIRHCRTHLTSSRFFVLNGDIFTDLSLPRMLHAHTRSGALATIALHEVEDPSRFGVIETAPDGGLLSFTEKPPRELARSRRINAGIYILEDNIFSWFPQGVSSMERDIFPRLLRDGHRLFGYDSECYWTDLGTPCDYLQAHLDVLAGLVHIAFPYPQSAPGIWRGDMVEIGHGATLLPPVVLGHGVHIADGATVGPLVVLGDDTFVGEGARIERSLTWEAASIEANSQVTGCILGLGAKAQGRLEGDVCTDFPLLPNPLHELQCSMDTEKVGE